jgi:hypothetical protein
MAAFFPLQIRDVERQTTKPTPGEYRFEAGKQTIEVLQKASTVIGIPFAREAVGVALALIGACEVCARVLRTTEIYMLIHFRILGGNRH